jgi:chromosome segregation ATPase
MSNPFDPVTVVARLADETRVHLESCHRHLSKLESSKAARKAVAALQSAAGTFEEVLGALDELTRTRLQLDTITDMLVITQHERDRLRARLVEVEVQHDLQRRELHELQVLAAEAEAALAALITQKQLLQTELETQSVQLHEQRHALQEQLVALQTTKRAPRKRSPRAATVVGDGAQAVPSDVEPAVVEPVVVEPVAPTPPATERRARRGAAEVTDHDS